MNPMTATTDRMMPMIAPADSEASVNKIYMSPVNVNTPYRYGVLYPISRCDSCEL